MLDRYSKRVKQDIEKTLKTRKLSCTDIVQQYCLGKRMVLLDGTVTEPLTKKQSSFIGVGAFSNIIYDEGYGDADIVCIVDVLDPEYSSEETIKMIDAAISALKQQRALTLESKESIPKNISKGVTV